MSKFDIQMSKEDFKIRYFVFGPGTNVKIEFRMSKLDIRPRFECQNRISNVKVRRFEFEC